MRGPEKIAIAERTLINGSTKLQGAKQNFDEEILMLTWRALARQLTLESARRRADVARVRAVSSQNISPCFAESHRHSKFKLGLRLYLPSHVVSI